MISGLQAPRHRSLRAVSFLGRFHPVLTYLCMLPTLSNEQRQAMEQLGTPLPLFDEGNQEAYVILQARVTPDPLGGYSAHVPGITAYGGGGTAEEATLTLSVVLREVLLAS